MLLDATRNIPFHSGIQHQNDNDNDKRLALTAKAYHKKIQYTKNKN